MVIIDAPPLLPVTDAAVLTTHCDGSLVVVSYGKTTDTELGDSLGHLSNVHATMLGVIFNRVPRHNAAGGYYGRYQEASTAVPALPADADARPTPAGRV
jgi:receptor protein-tyrosine kinase